MTITALPEDTVRLLGSHIVINTPVDLVKELVDNAIDAKATSVDILVSPNIVDKIEVRDNGQGVHPADYNSLGRAGHTSKITSFEDLRTLGGTTLGFRGQALAGANNIGTVTVTTRTAEDPIAAEMKLLPGVGGVVSQQRTSAPIGTTVSVIRLYSHLPVRKQVAVKNALNIVIKMKQLLHAYALARPQIRLSFRVLGQTNKQAFSYSPHPEASVREAVVQIFGVEVASQCLIRTICSGAGNENSGLTEDSEKFSIEAVLPRPDADQSRIAKGLFFSVDSRPVSAQRETMKKLLAIFKAQFAKILDALYGEKTFRDSFICINIRCSPGSYDPNVEPSKTVVLFADESHVIRLFEKLCAEVYCRPESHDPFATVGKRHLLPEAPMRTPPTSSDGPGHEEPIPTTPKGRPQHVVTHLQQRPLFSIPNPIREVQQRPVPRRMLAAAKTVSRGFTVDMSADPDVSSDEEAEMTASLCRQQEEASRTGEEDIDPMETLNPWTIAKMNAPARQTVSMYPLPSEQRQDSGQVQEQSEFAIQDQAFEDLPILRPFGNAAADLDGPRTARLDTLPASHQHFELPGFQHPLNHGTMNNTASHDALQPALQASETHTRQPLPILRHSEDIQSAGRTQNEESEEVDLDHVVQTRLSFTRRPRGSQSTRKGQVQRYMNEVSSKTNPPFRKPKRMSTRKRRPSMSKQGHIDNDVAEWVDNQCRAGDRLGSTRPQSTPQFSAPPRPRSGNMDIGTIQARLPSSASSGDDTLVDGDSRKYLMKRQRSEAEHRRRGRQPLKRVKTDRLPLEIVPQSQGMQHLVLPVELDTTKLAENLEHLVKADDLCNIYGTDIDSSEKMCLDDVVEVELRLQSLLASWTEKVLGERTDVDLELRSQVKGKMVAVQFHDL